jgi:hypothetical protein
MNTLTVKYQDDNVEIFEIPDFVMENFETFFAANFMNRRMSELVNLLNDTKHILREIESKTKYALKLIKGFRKIRSSRQEMENYIQNFIHHVFRTEEIGLNYICTPGSECIPTVCETLRILSLKRHFFMWFTTRIMRTISLTFERKHA